MTHEVKNMFVKFDEFHQFLEQKFAEIPLERQLHLIYRLELKLNRVHRALKEIYEQRKTIGQFQKEYPRVYTKIKDELSLFFTDQYLSQEGWKYFENNMFTPRYNVIVDFSSHIRNKLRDTSSQDEFEIF